ncbi:MULTISPECIES: ferredoxin [unclassified Rhodococcus (in: high G+C Gram-positive bacteria)]|uniref:ferredoxin n=1 Tax=unclassified Rhodococcus (in: high G+C Gram-positive bacteria) TaxID=192944 RepID=UPI0011EE3629|nr:MULTISPECIES: ferredoxin [unclassified Rhodococcus (in: high G+C Gram-positive bacteria)]KAA0924515.1 ferredoxin [Rhodococcus sp. ANT_H53B]MDI9926044.1 ferredoxin [Rhodococcus sp. IEGM 1341]
MTAEGRRGTALHIDWTRCDGRGVCTELLPDTLIRDEWGYPLARHGGSTVVLEGSDARRAADAVRLCPRMALRIR